MKTNFRDFIKDMAISTNAGFTIERFKTFVLNVDDFNNDHDSKSLYIALTNLQMLTKTPLINLLNIECAHMLYTMRVGKIFIDWCKGVPIDDIMIAELLKTLNSTANFYDIFKEKR